MTERSEREWLSDIIFWGERLRDHLSDVDRQAFFGSTLIHDAACKCVEAIGEAAGKLDDLDPDLDTTVPGLNLKLARKMRDRISHGYFQIDMEILWHTVTDAIPKTVTAARAVKPKYGGGDGGGGASDRPPI
jgi:uncharacterized protein with HEPN domain